MRSSDAIKFFGSAKAVADAIGITTQAVSQWQEMVPPLSAARLAKASRGKLKFDPDQYENWNRRVG